MGGFGSIWIDVGRCGSIWLVPRFSIYVLGGESQDADVRSSKEIQVYFLSSPFKLQNTN